MKLIRNRRDLTDEIKSIVLEPFGEIRTVLGKIVRRECKDFLAEYGETYLDYIKERCEKLVNEKLASLGSASFDQHTALAVELSTRQRAACICNPAPSPVKVNCPSQFHYDQEERNL